MSMITFGVSFQLFMDEYKNSYYFQNKSIFCKELTLHSFVKQSGHPASHMLLVFIDIKNRKDLCIFSQEFFILKAFSLYPQPPIKHK